jgi:hypothetical protein
MVRISICNDTEIDFSLIATAYTELENQKPFWLPSAMSAKAGFHGQLGKFITPENFGIGSEAFLTIFLVPTTADSSNSTDLECLPQVDTLAIRVRFRKDLLQTEVHCSAASLPIAHLLPPPTWHSGNQKVRLVVTFIHSRSLCGIPVIVFIAFILKKRDFQGFM